MAMTRIIMDDMDYTTKIASFKVRSVADIADLPKYEVEGKGILSTVKSVNFSSEALVMDTGEVYMLNDDNEWQIFG